jgi:steroid 5-alpha reductase family enzyme
MATFADDTAVLASEQNAVTASQKLQAHLSEIEHWLLKWRMKANATKSTHVTFTTRKTTCPPVTLNNTEISQEKSVKYLVSTWTANCCVKVHIQKEKKQVDNKYKNMWRSMGKKSQLSVTNKLLVYKVFLKSILTYASQLWGTASKNNIKIIER